MDIAGGETFKPNASRRKKLNHKNRRGATASLFRLVQMFTRRQVGELFKMFRPERLGNRVFGVEPFAEVNQLATVRAERPVFSR